MESGEDIGLHGFTILSFGCFPIRHLLHSVSKLAVYSHLREFSYKRFYFDAETYVIPRFEIVDTASKFINEIRNVIYIFNNPLRLLVVCSSKGSFFYKKEKK